MYSKYGKIGWAKQIFNEMIEKSLVSWAALIFGYEKSGEMTHAKKFFNDMFEIERGGFTV